MKNAQDISALKAVSQNLMHANLSVADGVYGILSKNDVQEQINNLGRQLIRDGSSTTDELIVLAKQLLAKLEAKN